MQPNPPDAQQDPEGVSSSHASWEAVGIISSSSAALQQVNYLLARDGVGVSKATQACLHREPTDAGGSPMADALEDLQGDPSTEVIVLIAQSPPPESAQVVLSQVRNSDKPTVICFLGIDQRLVLKAGAIPAGRLDEAAMRAAAWVRGWDQAFVSSRLEEQDERLSAWAGDLRRRVGVGRRGLFGLFSSRALHGEAQAVLLSLQGPDTVSPSPLSNSILVEAESQRLGHLRRALDDPDLAVVLVDTVLSKSDESEPTGIVAPLQRPPPSPLVISHVCSPSHDLYPAAALAARLRDEGIVVAPSSATAAHLAGSLIRDLT